MLKWAAAWQVVMTYVIFYVNEFGVDTINRLVFAIALFVGFLITFLKKDNTEKVAVAVGAIEKFIDGHSEKPKEDRQTLKIVAGSPLAVLFDLMNNMEIIPVPEESPESEKGSKIKSVTIEHEKVPKESFEFG